MGGGPFPTELEDATGEELRKIGNEFRGHDGRPAAAGGLTWLQLELCLHDQQGYWDRHDQSGCTLDAFLNWSVHQLPGQWPESREIPSD